ncbi:DMT family transporter [Qipengyuania qiaonensis]|uniref:DMT family transporter n=1 Tax=Qipengyuania qiaonensis TaxID=2867240 RepID=A0ABS7J319_9SPHN|nr:DMT family transporter [Qipengyuania qiaonensis]MBX7481721.1 DMT family transporter [Qipengyuania qiaonensis]
MNDPVQARTREDGLLVPLLLLLATGALLGLSTILAKLAPDAGLAPSAFLCWAVAGAAVLLAGERIASGHALPATRQTLEYYAIAALVSLAAPNFIFFAAVPRIGASFVALAIAFPPLLTYAAAVALRMERFDGRRAAGVALALAGAGLIAWLKLVVPDAGTGWILATLAGPVLLAIGNIYRSLRWPAGARPEELAPGMLLAAAAMLLLAGLLIPGLTLGVPQNASALGLVAAQAFAFAIQYRLFFILQKRGGPVLLSLLGSVGAIVAVPVAVLALGEDVPQGFATGALLIALGIGLVAGRSKRGAAIHFKSDQATR